MAQSAAGLQREDRGHRLLLRRRRRQQPCRPARRRSLCRRTVLWRAAHRGERRDPTKDTGIGQRIPAFEEALKANKKTYQLFIYEGAQHGFHNDTTPRYDEAAAKLAWQRTLEFFNKTLKTT